MPPPPFTAGWVAKMVEAYQGRRQAKKCGVDMHGERAICEPTTGVRGWSPQRSPGAKPLVRGHSPLKLKTF